MASDSAKTLIERAKSWFQNASGGATESGRTSSGSTTARSASRDRHADVSATEDELGSPVDDVQADAERQPDPAGPTGGSSNEFEGDAADDILVDPKDVERASESVDEDDSDSDEAGIDRELGLFTTDRERLDDTVERDDDHADVYPADLRGEGDLADKESPDVGGYAGGGQEQLDGGELDIEEMDSETGGSTHDPSQRG